MSKRSIFRNDLFAGKHVLVTGGGTGIGFAIAQTFGSLGAKVTIAARTVETLEQATATLKKDGIRASWRELNIRDADQVENLFETLAAEGNLPDILVNNAGGQFVSPALDISPNGFKAVMELNIQGTWQMMNAYARALVNAKCGGSIVNIVYQHTGPYKLISHGAAARAAVTNLSKSLALEWGPHDIRVNLVGPGYTDTDAIHRYDDKHNMEAVKYQPIQRLGSPQEIADAVCFLSSPASDFTTGAYLVVDGGNALMSSPDTQ